MPLSSPPSPRFPAAWRTALRKKLPWRKPSAQFKTGWKRPALSTAPFHFLPPTIESLARASALLNKSAVARLIGLEQRTLNARIKNRTPLTPKEAERLQSALQDNNLALI